MNQISPFFRVVAESDKFLICEAYGWTEDLWSNPDKPSAAFWRFMIEFDEDRDMRIIDVVNFLIAHGDMFNLGITRVAESKGVFSAWLDDGMRLPPQYKVGNDKWSVTTHSSSDDTISAWANLGWRDHDLNVCHWYPTPDGIA